MALPILKYRQWRGVLKSGGAVYKGQDGKNHHVWEFTPKVGTQPVSIAIAAHSDGADVLPVYINNLRRRWKLTKEDGVNDERFMRGEWT
jgi:hypothetical protein